MHEHDETGPAKRSGSLPYGAARMCGYCGYKYHFTALCPKTNMRSCRSCCMKCEEYTRAEHYGYYCRINRAASENAQKEDAPPSRPKAGDAPRDSRHDRRYIA
jgi:hypothetical protein